MTLRPGPGLRGRRSECEVLDGLVEAARGGESRALVVRGEAGVGKTALLEYLSARASGCRVERAAGVESELELPFAGLHQLCAPMLDGLERLPGPQRDALRTTFGLSGGDVPDRFVVGLAVLSLLSEAAEEQPLVCVVDDAQWLDQESAQALGFAARRLGAESVALVFAVREPSEEFAGLPELLVEGLSDGDARALLGSVIRGPVDERVRDRIMAETRGNPLALLELPRGLTSAELAGGFRLPDTIPLAGRIERGFLRRLESLAPQTRRLLLVAAAEPIGDATLLWRAAERLGIGADAAAAAEAVGLIEIGARVRFRHPLVRSAAYRSASVQERQDVHRALAEVTDPEVDPDRRAWHRAQATLGPDEEVAGELERSAGRAQARGGLAAAAAFLERAAALTPEPARRAGRALTAARAKHLAGAPDAALELLVSAEAGPLDELRRARVDLLRAQVVFESGRGRDAPTLLLKAARRLEPLDIDLARDTYLDALCALLYVGPLDSGCEPLDAAQPALAASRPGAPRATDLLLDGVAQLITDDYATAVPALRRALSAFGSQDVSESEELGWGWLACYIASTLWEHEAQTALAKRYVQLARDAGALVALPYALGQLAGIHLRNGELATAASMIEEVDAAIEVTRSDHPPYLALSLAAFQGREAEATALIETGIEHALFRGGGIGLVVVQWASALLYNGLGRYEDAVRAGLQVHGHPELLGTTPWTLPELIEAGSRSGAPDVAADALRRLSEMTQASGTDWALGLEARSRALLRDGDEAERLYRESIDRLGRAGVRIELARAHLLYGEWLRRENRRVDAREQLRVAYEMLTEMGIDAFAERARRELLATGETVRKRTVETRDELTAQEAQIARLAADGLSNPEIGAQLFLSPRTVEWHLKKVFTKLGIGSRRQLQRRDSVRACLQSSRPGPTPMTR
jgi:DNA-binding CsgD family transcriptional regulator